MVKHSSLLRNTSPRADLVSGSDMIDDHAAWPFKDDPNDTASRPEGRAEAYPQQVAYPDRLERRGSVWW